MRQLFSALALLWLASGCGGPSNPPAPPAAERPAVATAGVTTIPAIFSLFPADTRATRVPDTAPHPTLQRIVIQAPAGTAIRLRAGATDIPFSRATIELTDGLVLHELSLERPLGDVNATLTAGSYSLSLNANPSAAILNQPVIRPHTTNALASDLVQARSALFPSADSVALHLSGALPPLAHGLALRCGSGRPVPLALSMAHDGTGIIATATAPLRPDRLYCLYAGPDARSAFGATLDHMFSLRCLGSRDRRALRLRTADLNRDGTDELICLYADGALVAMSDPHRTADTLLPAGQDLALDFAVGDFTGNGAADLVVLMRGEHGSRLLRLENQTRNNGSRFAMREQALDLEAPVALASADFDRDGRDDLAILDAFGTVRVQYSSAPAQSIVALSPRMLAAGMVAADFTGDAKPDLFVHGADGVGRMLVNNGNALREPTAATTLRVDGAGAVAAGDLDGNASAELIVSSRDDFLAIVRNGNGGQLKYPARRRDESCLAGTILCCDVNGDSRRDLIVALEDDAGIADDIAIYLSHREASGEPDAVLPLGARLVVNQLAYWNSYLMIASDAGLLMLRVNSEEMPPSVDSKVEFVTAYTPVPRIPSPLAAAVQDFNDDGRADLATIDRDGMLRVWIAGADGEPFAPAGEAIDLGGQGALQAIDFDRDSFPDLLFIPDDPAGRPRVLRNNRRGGFGEDESGLLPTPPSGLRGAPALGDFDRDGDLDVFWPSPLGRVQFNDGVGRWRESRDDLEVRDERGMRLQFSGELCCADFTRDGIADIVAVMQPGDNLGPQSLVLWVGQGDVEGPAFRPVLTTALSGRFFGLAPADFSSNGRLDLALGYAPEGGEARLSLLRLTAGLTFEVFEGSPEARGELLDLAMDDLDRDGDLDLISTERIGDAIQTTVWINDGKGRFFEATEAQAKLTAALDGFGAVNLSLADFNGDGRPDLLAIDSAGNVVLVRTWLP